jgi:hypothetical protein
MFGQWLGPPLTGGQEGPRISRVGVWYFDPDHAADGNIPTAPPTHPTCVEFAAVSILHVFASGSADVRSIQEVPAVPEPSTFVLLGSGLAGLYVRRKR